MSILNLQLESCETIECNLGLSDVPPGCSCTLLESNVTWEINLFTFLILVKKGLYLRPDRLRPTLVCSSFLYKPR